LPGPLDDEPAATNLLVLDNGRLPDDLPLRCSGRQTVKGEVVAGRGGLRQVRIPVSRDRRGQPVNEFRISDVGYVDGDARRRLAVSVAVDRGAEGALRRTLHGPDEVRLLVAEERHLLE